MGIHQGVNWGRGYNVSPNTVFQPPFVTIKVKTQILHLNIELQDSAADVVSTHLIRSQLPSPQPQVLGSCLDGTEEPSFGKPS
jgi:hypothetical protein